MDTESLENIGLTKAETKIYLALLEIGLTTVGEVIARANLQSSVVHNGLHSLIKKGLVTYVLKGKIKQYQATDPKNILDFIEPKKQQFKSILPELILKQKLSKEKAGAIAEVYEGTKGVFAAFVELFRDAKPSDENLFFAVSEEYPGAQEFFVKVDLLQKERKFKQKGISHSALRHLFEGRTNQIKEFWQMRYVDFPLPSGVNMFGNKIILLEWGETPVCVLIKSEQIANNYRKLFEEVWKKGRK